MEEFVECLTLRTVCILCFLEEEEELVLRVDGRFLELLDLWLLFEEDFLGKELADKELAGIMYSSFGKGEER